ncbi:AAA family ATPase [Fischerella sp. PCC 9605]|uniref:AAA family ATPase n=1 Tax=Fischerella sp. PCC 9605 TaxID=1173024 RepID=UPI00047D9B41|nr:AAA family ATPase [Fischerella sp. PCC 9605]
MQTHSMEYNQLLKALLYLPINAPQATIGSIFIPELLKTLGYDVTETIPNFATGNGTDKVDYAVRRDTDKDIFIHTKSNPYLLIELKGRDTNLSENSTQYKSTVSQLKRYLLAPNCQSVQWGIITNSIHIQLFRKHGKVIHPCLPCQEITPDNVDEIVQDIKAKVDTPQKALTVAIYNNKGGVGKTTTTLNLAATLAYLGKQTLIIDFDPSQQDLTNSLALKPKEDVLYSWLEDKASILVPPGLSFRLNFQVPSKGTVAFDIIPSDQKLMELGEEELRQRIKISRLRQVIEPLKYQYDYILIDSPPNWRLFSQSAVYASDVVLIPTKHNSMFSLKNAAVVIQRFIPEIQTKRNDGGPIALPIFYNGESITEAQIFTAQKEIDKIINKAKTDTLNPIDLTPYFYPKYTQANQSRHIFNIPSYAHIASAAFTRIPAVYKNRTAYEHYLALAKEYFLQ